MLLEEHAAFANSVRSVLPSFLTIKTPYFVKEANLKLSRGLNPRMNSALRRLPR